MNQSSRWQSAAEMIRRVSSGRGRELTGLYSIEGSRLVERALRAGAPLTAALTTERFAGSPRGRDLAAALLAAGVPLVYAPDEVVAELTEGRDLGHILCLVRLPADAMLERILSAAGRPPTAADDPRPTTNARQPHPSLARAAAPSLLLAAVDITDPGNAGALTRTAHAGGAAALLVVGASDPFHPRATRISRGSIFRLPIISYDSAGALLADLTRCGVVPVATAAGGGLALPDLVLPDAPVAVLMGNEAEGLAPSVAAAVEHHVTIPMPAGVDSYSVNAAAAIVLYELQRRRWLADRYT